MMESLEKFVSYTSGTPQFRIQESLDRLAPTYTFYSQQDLAQDLGGLIDPSTESKQIRTKDTVNTLAPGDMLFSCISGTAALISPAHQGYLYTQNYVKLCPEKQLDAAFLVYLINENTQVRQQLTSGLQGSQVLKYTIKQIKSLQIPRLPPIDKQRLIGGIYLNQLRLQALQTRRSQTLTTIRLHQLEMWQESPAKRT